MGTFHDWLNTLIAAVTPIVLLWQLSKAKITAAQAAAHAREAAMGVEALQADLHEIATNTNSIVTAALAAKDDVAVAQASAADAAGEKRGIAIGISQNDGSGKS